MLNTRIAFISNNNPMNIINDLSETGKVITNVGELIKQNRSMRQVELYQFVLLLKEIGRELEQTYRKLLRYENPLAHCIMLEEHARNLHQHLLLYANEQLALNLSNKLLQKKAIDHLFDRVQAGTVDLTDLNKIDEAAACFYDTAEKLRKFSHN